MKQFMGDRELSLTERGAEWYRFVVVGGSQTTPDRYAIIEMISNLDLTPLEAVAFARGALHERGIIRDRIAEKHRTKAALRAALYAEFDND